jgi:hypothetical protein
MMATANPGSATAGPTFLYPTSRQFPFDEVCEQIVRTLEDRNWDVPGITVEFHNYGSGDQKYRLVSDIRGDGFQLHFGRVQRRLGHYNDTAAVSQLVIPGKQLDIYDDESGPTYYVYVGESWERDKERFLRGSKVNSRLDREGRWYLMYKGACRCGASDFGQHYHSGRRPPLLVHDNDLGREYDTNGLEPKSYRTSEVLEEFRSWLQDTLLARILEHPPAAERIDIFQGPAPTPFPQDAGPIFCFGSANAARRVYQGRLDPDQLSPDQRFAFSANGYSLLGSGGGQTVPEVAYGGFRWCGLGPVAADTNLTMLEIPGHDRWGDREQYVFRITPSRADGIYIADNAVYERRRAELFEAIAPRTRLTDAELAEAEVARALTIVPIAEYTGGYEQPVVLINRELGFDEVELVSGPWPEYRYVRLIARKYQGPLETALEVAHDRTRLEGPAAALLEAVKDDQELAAAAAASPTCRIEVNKDFIWRVVRAAKEARDLGLL